jgi:serine/threonine protein kinase
MGIATGTTLGRYEVRSLLGAGGMGEVYLAQDNQLRRPVALKLLPAQFTQDEDRLRRFEQEAYAASALNHPNILTIYEIGHIEATRFIAMEYVEGETLRHHLARSNAISGEGHSTGHGIRLHEALDIAIQIASALAAAQTAGIAHRDIKPENLMLRRDGYLKVLDFGLAKLTERPETTDTEAPTRAMVNTSPGAVMGTVNYMSPEQASGLTVDSRSDIWSLGVLLYEMVTGHMPFEGPTPSHVIVAILERDPPVLTRYITDAPEALEWIITKALTKNRDDRYQTAREMLTDLRRLKQRLDASAELERSISPDSGNRHIHMTNGRSTAGSTLSAFSTPATNTQFGAPTVSSAEYIATSMGRHKLGIIAAVVLLLAAAGAVTLWLKTRAGPTHTFGKVRLSQLTNTGKAGLATISPDGKYVVHVISDGRQASLWVRQIATASNVQIVPAAESRYIGLTFSQDGDYIYYVVYEKNSPLGVVYQIPVLGGTPRKIIEDVDTPVTFSPDGKRFAWIRNFPLAGETALMVANSDGSQQRKAASRLRPARFQVGPSVGPSWSPKGDLVACPVGGLESNVDRGSIALIDANTGAEKDASPLRWAFVQQVAWAPNGNSIVTSAQEAQGGPNQIWHIGYPDGVAERITNDLNNYSGVSLNRDGTTLATVQSQISSSVWFTSLASREDASKVTFGTNEGGRGLALMPDGRIIYTVAGSGTTDLFIVNADGSDPRQLTSNAGLNGVPSPTLNGRFIVFLSTRSGVPHLWRMDSDGSNVKQLTSGIAEVNPVVSPDGKWIIYQNINDLGLWKISIDGGTPQLVTNKLASQASISPDGKLLACRYREQDLSDFKLGIIDMANGQTVRTMDIPPTDTTLRWSADGRAVLYAERRAGISNVWSQPIDGSAPRQLTNFKADQIFGFDVSADGKSLVFARGTVSNDVVLIADTTN